MSPISLTSSGSVSVLRFAIVSSSVASRITDSLLPGSVLLAAAMLVWSGSLRVRRFLTDSFAVTSSVTCKSGQLQSRLGVLSLATIRRRFSKGRFGSRLTSRMSGGFCKG